MDQTSHILFLIALSVTGLSILLRFFISPKWATYLLLAGTFLLALSAIHRDDYLHPWDERYHALVAKNMMESPLEPKLYREIPIKESLHTEWYNAHVWLHKQPLFLWQMALSMKVFGDGLVGMRLASALMYLLFCFSVFKAAHLYFPKSSFLATFLAAIQPYLLLLISGRQGMDHNDIAFIAWVSVSFWGLTAYLKKRHWKWVLLIGLGAGLAMLTKWLAGSFIIWVWGLHLLLAKNTERQSWLHLLSAALIALIIFMPWQVYAYLQWPDLFLKEWQYNSRHFSEVIEEHQQPWYFYLGIWKKHFALVSGLFLLGTSFVVTSSQNRKILIAVILSIFAALTFYTLAETKLASYTLFLLPLLLFVAASFLERITKSWLRTVIGLLIIYFGYLEFRNQYLFHTENPAQVKHLRSLKTLSQELKHYGAETVIFNVPPLDFVDFMFYTDQLAYQFLPTQAQVQHIRKEGYKAVVLLPPGQNLDPSLIGLVEVKRTDVIK